jgi:hypothetical protein
MFVIEIKSAILISIDIAALVIFTISILYIDNNSVRKLFDCISQLSMKILRNGIKDYTHWQKG